MDRTTKRVIGAASLLGCGLFALGAGAVALLFAAIFTGMERDIVTHPDATLTVVDEGGAPLPGAHVRFVWSSLPHHMVHDTLDLDADATGSVHIDKREETERVMPLCMHGVPEHMWELCVEAEGRVPVVITLYPGAEPLVVEVPLHVDADPSPDAPHCDAADRPWFRTERADLSRAHPSVLRAEEIRARDPALAPPIQ